MFPFAWLVSKAESSKGTSLLRKKKEKKRKSCRGPLRSRKLDRQGWWKKVDAEPESGNGSTAYARPAPAPRPPPDSALGVRGAPCALHAAPLPPGLAAVRTVHRPLSAEAFLFIHSVTFLRMSYMPGTLKSGGCRSGHNRPVPPNPVAGGPSTPFSALTLQGSTRAFSLCSGPPALPPSRLSFARSPRTPEFYLHVCRLSTVDTPK